MLRKHRALQLLRVMVRACCVAAVLTVRQQLKVHLQCGTCDCQHGASIMQAVPEVSEKSADGITTSCEASAEGCLPCLGSLGHHCALVTLLSKSVA